MDILLLLSGLTAAEATVYTGMVAVIHAHDVHEDHVTRLNEAVGAQMGVRMRAITTSDLNVMDPLCAESMHLI